MKDHKTGKKSTGKKSNEIYIIAFILSVGQSPLLLFNFIYTQEVLFNKLKMNLVPTFTNYNQCSAY